MINLKKLAMISAMGMVLSTSAMAENHDSSFEVTRTAITVGAATSQDGDAAARSANRGGTIAEGAIGASFALTGEKNEEMTDLSAADATFTDGDGHDITVSFEAIANVTFDGNGDANVEVDSSALTIAADATFATYSGTVVLSAAY